jgi:dolichol-phosphate mannosyltransferase
MSNDIFVSVLIPAKNEANNLKPLLEEVRVALADESYEIIVVDDGSTDATLHELQQAKNNGLSQLRILHHDRSLGQSTSLYHAAQAARGQWLATLDGDGQNDPADIPGMLALVRNPRGRATCNGGGHRVNRRDTASKRWASRFANGLRSRLLKDATPDTGCGLKLIQRAAFLRLPYFDHMHRYIPALIQRHNGRMVVHPVNHRHRTAGVSKYGNIDRALVGILDLFGVWWLIKRTRLNTQAREVRGMNLSRESLWLVVGFAGQLAFTGRFVLQWLYSEYKKRSVIPTSFWYLSIVGSALLLMYAIYRQDPVFIAGQAFGFIVYLRNLQLIAKSKPQGIIMRRSLSPRVECLGLMLLALLLVGAGLGLRQVQNVDEERFLGVALEMLHNGSWLIPHAPGRSTATNHRSSCGRWRSSPG